MADKQDFDILESTAEIASMAKEAILNGEAVDKNMKVYAESVRLLNELSNDDEEDDIEKEARISKINAESAKIMAETEKLVAEKEAEEEMAKLNLQIKEKDLKNYKLDTALKIAKESAPYVGAAATIGTSIYTLERKCNFATKSVKLLTIIEQAGIIPGIKKTKVLETIFSNILKG